HQQNDRMNETPHPARGRSHKALLEITSDELIEKHTALHQIAREMFAGNSHAGGNCEPRNYRPKTKRALRISAPPLNTPSCSMMTVGAEELLHGPDIVTLCPSAVSASPVAGVMRASRFSFPGTNSW